MLLEIKRKDFLGLLDHSRDGGEGLDKACGVISARLRQSSQDVIRLTIAVPVALGS
jgi:hypothetical protein